MSNTQFVVQFFRTVVVKYKLFIKTIYFPELEDKLLREWIEQFIKRYNTNIQSSGESTKNIQRIAKRNRMRTSTTNTQKYENIAPFPIYPFFFNPYYQPTIYSSYIPLSYDESTRLIPVSQLSYPLLLPTQLPHESTHIPSINKPAHVQTYVTPINQIEIRKYDKPDEIPTREYTTEKPLSQNHSEDEFDHTLPTLFHQEKPVNADQKKYRESESQGPKNDRKLLDNMNQFQNPITTEFKQIDESRDVQQPLLSTTVIKLGAFAPSQEVTSSKTHKMTSTATPMTISEMSNLPSTFRNSVSQLPWNTKYNLSSNEFGETTRIYSQSTITQGTPLSFTSELPDTTIETELTTSKTNESEKSSIVDDENQLNEPGENLPDLKSSNNINTTILISSTKIVENLTEIPKAINYPETIITSSTSLQPTTTLLSIPLSENNNYLTSKSSSVMTPGTYTTLHANSYDSSVQIKSVYSTIANNDEYGNQSNLINSSSRQFSISTSNSETTTIPYATSKSSTIRSQSSTSSPEVFTLFNQSNSIKVLNMNNENQSTSLLSTILLSSLQPLNSKNSTTFSTLTEAITKKTPLTSTTPSFTINYDNFTTNINKYKHNTDTPTYEKSTISPLTTKLSNRNNFPRPEKNFQNNILSDVNNFSKNYLDGFQSTERTNMHKKDKIHSPVITTGTRKSSLKSIVTPITPLNSIQRKLPHVAVSNNFKQRKSTNIDQDRITPKPKNFLTYKDSELWYNHMHTQNPYKKELSEEQIDFLLKKIIKLLKPEIEKQILTKESISRIVVPKLGDQEKLIQIIIPLVKDAAKSIENEERIKNKENP